MKSILITNDDGIHADGLIRLSKAAAEFGEVWVVAPESQRSAASHSITLHSPVDVFPYDFPVKGVRAFSCSGTPGDCVRTGSLYLMPHRPDVVLSGINYGYNIASDVQYSATVGAALEAAFQGVPGIALSENQGDCHEVTDAYLPEVLEMLLDQEYVPEQIFNVNFPGCRLTECRGILTERTVSRSMFYKDHYKAVGQLDGGGIRLMVEGVICREAEEGTDFKAIISNFVSIGTVRNIG